MLETRETRMWDVFGTHTRVCNIYSIRNRSWVLHSDAHWLAKDKLLIHFERQRFADIYICILACARKNNNKINAPELCVTIKVAINSKLITAWSAACMCVYVDKMEWVMARNDADVLCQVILQSPSRGVKIFSHNNKTIFLLV